MTAPRNPSPNRVKHKRTSRWEREVDGLRHAPGSQDDTRLMRGRDMPVDGNMERRRVSLAEVAGATDESRADGSRAGDGHGVDAEAGEA